MVDKRQQIEDEANCVDIHKMLQSYNSLTERSSILFLYAFLDSGHKDHF